MPTAFVQPRKPWKNLLIAIVAVLALSWLSSLPVTANMAWYEGLEKASFNPPSWSFGVVWPILYIMMTIAAWLIWHPTSRNKKQVQKARAVFIIQLICNLLWTPIFFGLQSPLYGLAWIAVVWAAVALTLALFWRIRRLAGILLLPYLAWVSFAALLNYSILMQN
jgi:translocator protein